MLLKLCGFTLPDKKINLFEVNVFPKCTEKKLINLKINWSLNNKSIQ